VAASFSVSPVTLAGAVHELRQVRRIKVGSSDLDDKCMITLAKQRLKGGNHGIAACEKIFRMTMCGAD
jgi:hypothetical protein